MMNIFYNIQVKAILENLPIKPNEFTYFVEEDETRDYLILHYWGPKKDIRIYIMCRNDVGIECKSVFLYTYSHNGGNDNPKTGTSIRYFYVDGAENTKGISNLIMEFEATASNLGINLK